MKKKNREHSESLESNKKKCMQSVEVCPHSPLLFEDQSSQDIYVHKKKSKKKKTKQEKQDSWLDNSCIGGTCEVNNETVTDASKKKMKKKKRKHSVSEQEQNNVLCIHVNQEMDTTLERVDYTYVNASAKKKKRKKNLSEEQDEVNKLPGLYAFGNDCRSQKKKKRKQSSPCETQEASDETFASSSLSYSGQNSTSSQERNDEVMMSGSSSKMSIPVVPKKRHKTHKGGKSSRKDKTDMREISSVFDENPLDVTADISMITSEGNNGCSEETIVPVRNIDFPFQSHSEQATSEAKRTLPESVASETEEHQDVGFTESENSIMLNNEEFLESSKCSAMDLETVKRKLEEFIPQVWTLSETSILKMAGRDLIRFKKFKEQGMPIKFGRFSQKENTQIQKNIEDFLSLTEIENAEKLLFTYRYPEEQQAITKLKTKYAFGMKIAEGIPRPWKQVYFRARKMFDPNNYKGRYSEDEKEKLKKFYAIHGNNWKKISEMMSRSTHSVAMKYSQIKSQVNSGPWSKEETQKLVQAVKETIQKRADLEDIQFLLQAENSDGTLSVEREQLYKNISWTEIEAKVGTRYWRQCKQKWISIVTKKMSNGQNVYSGTKGLQAKIKLIKRLYEMKVEDANEVNWEELCEIIGDVPEAYVQAKFYKLKATSVPSWQTKTFPEIIDYLYDETLPLLEKRLEKRQKRPQSCDMSPSSCERKVFQFSDIFDYNEDDADDND
ncbi:transcription termination factor 1 [Malaclemys terrapin pileata]|uniref:transcription termination factor 1 n=1 Tax=Malaclemys terrapin pileata TaxID=2991368 RepID=UPI0023A8AF1A|nr:transcription termination factor 1 [Malaclemys terrapin pileata]XP_053863819.1 transcription termination factor 1 [Malaclemys terrapin pileata]XP_053863820.1 transcription termination factor 1 [Malaclemys terrapin pileata]